ncbi:tetratricopeptide repeat protein [Aeromonas veronii]|uniref:tetratricopeptide repeat protein n=1 Tax=Aeromonas veronii TaxID=654 RepID=UPI003AB057D7
MSAPHLVVDKQAAEQGDSSAQNELGVRYADGEDVPQNDRIAAIWLRKAAEQGNPSAHLNLGGVYERGQGVPQDYKLAYVWYSIATANGTIFGKTSQDNVAKKLTPAELAAAQTLAAQYFEKYQPKQ